MRSGAVALQVKDWPDRCGLCRGAWL